MTPLQQAAARGLLVQYAMDMHVADRANLSPPPDPRLAPDWRLLGYLQGPECLFRVGKLMAFGEQTCYGYLAQSTADPADYQLNFRGTDGLLNWIQNAQFVKTAHPGGGVVELGFKALADALTYCPLAGTPAPARPALLEAVGDGALTMPGHSLGAAATALLAFDLAAPEALGARVIPHLWACPHVGDAAFAAAFQARVKSYLLCNYEFDPVPRLPLGLGYVDLQDVTWIDFEDAEARVKMDSLLCQHHLLCYLARAYYALADWKALAAVDQSCASCILGPRIQAVTAGLAL